MKKLISLMLTSLTILLLMLNCDDRKDMDIGEKPIAKFLVSDSVIKVGSTVYFTDSSLNSPDKWLWEFGDNNQNTSENASYIYNNPGTYIVKLTVTNNAGVDSTKKQIRVGSPPIAYFKAGYTFVFLGNTVQFSDTSANSPTSWRWDFGDGNYSTEQNPTYKYNALGTYNVVLAVSNMFGSDTLKKEDYISVIKLAPFDPDTIYIQPFQY